MRQVFSSPRLENAEQVAKLLEGSGIATRITNGRSYKGYLRGHFSYSEYRPDVPTVWVMRSDDQPRARQILREADLLDSTHNEPDSYLARSFRGGIEEMRDPGYERRQARISKIKYGLIIGLLFATGIGFFFSLSNAPEQPVIDTVAISKEGILPIGKVEIPDSLAIAILRHEIPMDAGQIGCISVDGQDITQSLIASLPKTQATLFPMSQCPAMVKDSTQALPVILSLGNYATSPSGNHGVIQLLRRRGNNTQAMPLSYEVRQENDSWHVVQLL